MSFGLAEDSHRCLQQMSRANSLPASLGMHFHNGNPAFRMFRQRSEAERIYPRCRLQAL